jgi:hypothetical protein
MGGGGDTEKEGKREEGRKGSEALSPSIDPSPLPALESLVHRLETYGILFNRLRYH